MKTRPYGAFFFAPCRTPRTFLKAPSIPNEWLTRQLDGWSTKIDVRGGASWCEAPWSEFNLDEARWTIPAERMKMKTPHVVPLSRQAVKVLRALKQIMGNGHFVFEDARDKKSPSATTRFSNPSTVWATAIG